MIWCVGGPAMMKRQRFPPEVEIPERGGVYVLDDEGDPTCWRYLFLDAAG